MHNKTEFSNIIAKFQKKCFLEKKRDETNFSLEASLKHLIQIVNKNINDSHLIIYKIPIIEVCLTKFKLFQLQTNS